jgi:protein involved in polysaccharide export with SLBB domain
MKTRQYLFFLSCILASALPSVAAIIKSGDVIDIQVVGHPEFSGKFTVNENGMVDHPLLADEVIVNVSTSELMNDLTFRLARHFDNPLVLVTVIDKPEITVTVLGQVVDPGPVTTFKGATIQEVLKKAGGPTPTGADLARIKIIHSNSSDAPEIFNMETFLSRGNVQDLPRLEADDIVIVLGLEKSKKVKVIGAVQKPGLFTLEEKMNLFEVIYLAGGPTEKSDFSRIRRFTRQENGNVTEEIIDMQGFIDKGRMDDIPDVLEGDVIIVYNRWFDWRTVLTVLNNTLLFIVTIQAFSGLFK